ncbi:MAG: transposase [Thermaceae bacterium]|nr:transposase [Thermaceae bacterium]
MRGYDRGKKVKGRKRHLLVDTQGLVLKVRVLAANITDPAGGRDLLQLAKSSFEGLRHRFVDGGYKRTFVEWVKETLGWIVDVIKRPDAPKVGICWPDDVPMPPDLIEELRKKTRCHHCFLVIPRRWAESLPQIAAEPLPEGGRTHLGLAQLQPQTQPRL